jgi:Fe-S-cluster containining protein
MTTPEHEPVSVWTLSDSRLSQSDQAVGGAVAAGDFSAWLTQIQGALESGAASDVPCNGCTACCRSSQFVHIAPDETDTLAHIPPALLFPAPRRPPGHVVLGYDEHGHCPMLVDDRCSIYEHRPRTCRTYDCRVFPAAGIDATDETPVAERARRWQFGYATDADRNQHAAVRAAAAFLADHPEVFGAGGPPVGATSLAVLAIEVHEAFVRRDEASGTTAVVDPDPGVVRVEVMRRRRAPGGDSNDKPVSSR